MDSIIKQVQEACAEICIQEACGGANFNSAARYMAERIKNADLSHLTGPRCACGDSFTEDAMCANCLAAKDSASPLSGWQDISTAPKDFVTKFDGWNGERVPDVFWSVPLESTDGKPTWCHHEYIQDYGWVRSPVYGLTHWHPIPAPPKPSK